MMKKSWTWSVSGYNLTGLTDAEIIALCRLAGLSGIETHAERYAGQRDTDLPVIRAEYEGAGLRLESFHLPMDTADDIACFYETSRRQTVARFQRLLDRAALLGVRVVIQHPSTNRFSVETEGFDRYLRQMGKSLEVLLPHAADLGIIIALENMLPAPDGARVGSHPEHFTRFAQAFDHPHLGFCLDTGHALIAGGPQGPAVFFDAMAARLVAFHLADNAGDRDLHLAPGHGLVDWRVIFTGLARINYRHAACIEAPPFAHGPHGTYGADAWKGMLDDTEALAASALTAAGV